MKLVPLECEWRNFLDEIAGDVMIESVTCSCGRDTKERWLYFYCETCDKAYKDAEKYTEDGDFLFEEFVWSEVLKNWPSPFDA